ncbi:MAG: hypothetical protein KAI79_06565 [Bacteroidales bacterium]|nr:hypothetical protein [Bacteroidales bacterium]
MKKIMHFFFLSCLRATELIEKKIHMQLDLKEEIQLKLHKSMCKACSNFDKQSVFIDVLIKSKEYKKLNINTSIFKEEIKKKIFE